MTKKDGSAAVNKRNRTYFPIRHVTPDSTPGNKGNQSKDNISTGFVKRGPFNDAVNECHLPARSSLPLQLFEKVQKSCAGSRVGLAQHMAVHIQFPFLFGRKRRIIKDPSVMPRHNRIAVSVDNDNRDG